MLVHGIIILLQIFINIGYSEKILYVKPYNLSSCPPLVAPCYTLEWYAIHQSDYFKTGNTFIFLSGDHTTSIPLQLKSVSRITLKGMEVGAKHTKISMVVECENVLNLTLHCLTLNFTHNQSASSLTLTNSSMQCSSVIFLGSRRGDSNSSRAISFSHSNATINNCTFMNNSATLGGAVFISKKSNITLNEINFTGNCAKKGGAIYVDDSNLWIVTGTVFIKNFADDGGGIFCQMSTITGLHGMDCICNSASHNGGMMALLLTNATFYSLRSTGNHGNSTLFLYRSNVTFFGNTIMNGNSGLFGGALTAESSLVRFMDHTTFEKNKATKSGGALAGLVRTKIFISGVTTFINNFAYSDGGGVMATIDTEVFMSGSILFRKSWSHYGGAISLTEASRLIISDNVTFENNWAWMGGAIYVRFSTVVLKEYSRLLTIANYANYFGGAIYHQDNPTSLQCCLKRSPLHLMDQLIFPNCFLVLENFNFDNKNYTSLYQIHSYNDSAQYNGDFLYGGLLDRCHINDTDVKDISTNLLYNSIMKYNIFNIQHYSTDGTNAISSDAYTLCFCEGNKKYDYTLLRTFSIIKGGQFNISLIAFSQGNNTITSAMLLAITFGNTRLGPFQEGTILPPRCTTVTYNLYSTEEATTISIHTNVSYTPDVPHIPDSYVEIMVNFLPCPNGFVETGDHCGCEERLLKYNVDCYVSNNYGIIKKKQNSRLWIGVHYLNESDTSTNTSLILCNLCLSEHCNATEQIILLDQQDQQCKFGRSGILCGACSLNYSLVIGNSMCQMCSNKNLFLIAVFAAAGIFLVLFLSLLKLTVATGIINSIIFYANILQANKTIFFPTAANNFLTVFVAWINLDFGFLTCFYDGMDAYTLTWLQFIFPSYIWVLIISIILISRCSSTMTRLLGTNPVAVLATLLLMSYAKLLRLIIQIFSFVELDYPNNVVVVAWLKDANVLYFKGRHLILAIFTSIFIAIIFIPYTFLLLLGFKLYYYSNRTYISGFMRRIKPLLDSYFAPYKKHTRCWTGFLLLLQCGLFVVFSYNSVGGTGNSLLAINTACTSLLIINLLSGRIYKSFYVNTFEVLVILDLIILSSATSNNANSPALVYSLVSLVFALIIGVIFYQFQSIYLSRSAVWLTMTSFLATHLKQKKKQMTATAKAETDPLIPPVSGMVTTSTVRLRESMMEDCSSTSCRRVEQK